MSPYPDGKLHVDLNFLVAEAKKNNLEFQQVISAIKRHYECTAVAFRTGAGTPLETINPAGSNAASCLLLAFARRLGLDETTTLGLYGEHYRAVTADPEGHEHPNIRAFMSKGWAGVLIEGDPLRLRGPG